jgi:pimeloyl-ACP methyl ester carboxylesterase
MCQMTYGDVVAAARLSESAYAPSAFIVDQVTELGMTHVTHLSRAGTFATIAIDDRGVLWLAFRGTQIREWEDLNSDRKVFPRREGEGLVHRGFVSALDQIWDEIVEHCARYSCRVVITGHSLGGALAQLAACRLGLLRRNHGLRKPDLVTFGCPLVGTRRANRQLLWAAGDVVRVTNGGDPIPWLFAWPIYQHPVCARIHLTGDGDVFVNPTRWRLLAAMQCGRAKGIARFIQCLFQTRSPFRAWLRISSVFDHSVYRYREQLVAIYRERLNDAID